MYVHKAGGIKSWWLSLTISYMQHQVFSVKWLLGLSALSHIKLQQFQKLVNSFRRIED